MARSAEGVVVQDMAKKLKLLLVKLRKTDKELTDVKLREKVDESLRESNWTKIKSGTRYLTDQQFKTLSKLSEVSRRDWQELDFLKFGRKLGLRKNEIGDATNIFFEGIDFLSRQREDSSVSDLFDLIKGYWGIYYYCVGKKEKSVARDLCIIRRVNGAKFIRCELYPLPQISFLGWAFQTRGNHLYFIFEKQKFGNEIIVCLMNRPMVGPMEGEPAELYGISLCLSGGYGNGQSLPSATKIVCKKIFSLDEVTEEQERRLKNDFPVYLNPRKVDKEILAQISNEIKHDDLPFALMMPTLLKTEFQSTASHKEKPSHGDDLRDASIPGKAGGLRSTAQIKIRSTSSSET